MLEPLWRTPPNRPLPGLTMIMFDPIEPISARMLCLDPLPMASIAITEATPMMMPSIVRKQRILLFRSALMQILSKLLISIA